MYARFSRRARMRVALATAAAVLTGGLVVAGGAPALAVPGDPHASVLLGATPTYDGVTAAWPGDRDKSPTRAATTVAGTSCWALSQDPLNRYLYVDVATAAKPSGSKYANVTITYHDAAATTMRIEYDGTAGRFQASPSVTLDGTGSWRTQTIQLDAIRFLNGTNSADFRINVSPANGVVPPVCFSEVSVTFSDVPRLSLTNPSLLLTTDDAALDFGTLASTVSYALAAEDGTSLRSGSVTPDASGKASLDVSDLGPGYYGITFSGTVLGETITREASFGIVTPTPAGALDPDSFFGISTHFGHYGASEDALMDSLATIGYGRVRGDVNWELIEKKANTYDFASYAFDRKSTQALGLGMTPMGVVAYKNPLYDGGRTPSTTAGLAAFGRFAAATAAEYAPEIKDFSIYNEFNGTGFNSSVCGMTASCYIEMLEATYGPMHAANPDVNVLGPITSTINAAWNDEFFANGGLDHIDTFATNVYGYALNGPNTPPEETLLVSALPALVARVDQEAGTRDVPVWITENGWPTHAIGSTLDEQAEDLVRANILIMAAGVDVNHWYSALDDGADPNEREHNFGIFRRPDAAALGITPKPAAVTSAVLIREVTGKSIQAREDLGEAGVYSYPFTGTGGTTRVMWAPDADASVVVKGSGPVTVVDGRGGSTTFTPPTAGTYLDLDGEPLYLKGAVTSVATTDSAPELTVAEQGIVAQPLRAEVAMKRSALQGPHKWLSASATGAPSEGFSVARGVLRSRLELPPTSDLGERTARVAVTDGRGKSTVTIALLRGRTTTVEPFTMTAHPRIVERAGGRDYALDVTLRNNSTVEVAPGTLDFLIGGVAGTLGDLGGIAPGGSEVYRIDAGDPVLYLPHRFRAELGGSGRGVVLSGSATFAPLEREGAAALPPIDLLATGSWVGSGGALTGPDDLSGSLRVTHEDDGLVLDVTVADDIHHGDRDSALLWQTDSIQFAVYDRAPRAPGGAPVEIGAALLRGEAQVRTFVAPKGQQAGATPGADAVIERDEDAGTTHYRVRLPWAALGFAAAPTEPFAMSFLVNDDDTGASADARDGFLQWGSGVGTTPKDPALFRDVQLVG